MTRSGDSEVQSSDDSKRNGKPGKRSVVQFDRSQSLKELQELDGALKISAAAPYERLWEKLLVAAAVVDILNTYLPPMLREKAARARALVLEEEERKRILPKFVTFWKKDPGSILDLTAEQCVDGIRCMYERAIYWMEDHRMLLNWIFCVCWILDSVRKAHSAWKAAEERERTKPRGGGDGIAATKTEARSFSPLTPARRAFLWTLLFRLSLLPLGFYTLGLVDHVAIVTLNEGSSIDRSRIDPSEDGTAPNYNRYSVLFALVLKLKAVLVLCLTTQIATLKAWFAKRIAPRVLKFAILQPRLFKHRIASLLVLLRWLKYLVPIFQKAEKFLKTLKNVAKMHRQRRERTKRRREKRRYWDGRTPEERAEAAAVRLQTAYRVKTARREAALRRIFGRGRRRSVLAGVTSVLRMRAAAARGEIRRKKSEVLRLSTAPGAGAREDPRLKKLQVELGSICKKKALGKMLLRPNTKFIIGWKIMFMICIGVEMVHKASQSKHVGGMDEATELQLHLEAVFVPNPIEDWASCAHNTARGNRILGMFNASKTSAAIDLPDLPWYCDAPWTTIQSGYIHFVHFLIYNGLSCMSIVFFLDVFVNFFTGIYDKNGFLVENKFFPRWIFPGIGFQLLVNPRVKDVSAVVKTFLHHPGPARVYQWLVAFVIPILAVVVYWLKWNVWMVLVSSENKKTSSR